MIYKQITTIEAEEGMVLYKDGVWSQAVMLKEGQAAEEWTERPYSDYEEFMKAAEAQEI